MTTFLFDYPLLSFIYQEIDDGNPERLICYDLCNNLPKIRRDITDFSEILDIYLLETICFLGKYHKNYFRKDEKPLFGLRKKINENDLNCNEPGFWTKLASHAENLKKIAIKTDVWNHYVEIEIPFSVALHSLTLNGICLNKDKIKNILNFSLIAEQKITYALELNNVNGTSIEDLNEWIKGYGFFEFLSPGQDRITVNELSLLKYRHQVFQIFSRLEKLRRIQNFLKGISNCDKIKPFYKTMGAVTGRCTSIKPNIMGIPKIFRPIIIPSRSDFGIVECDYSQMEVGILAALSGDIKLIKDFNSTDVYRKTGELFWGDTSDVSREKAKIIFLGIQYGLSLKSIVAMLESTEKEVTTILEQLFNRYQTLSKHLTSQVKFGIRNGFSENISGLKRYRRDISTPSNYWERNWYRNFPVQSSGATVFKKAIVDIYRAMKNDPFHLLVPLYDSVVFECPIDQLPATISSVKECMVKSMNFFFPALVPKISINDVDVTCWNSQGKTDSIEAFLNDPLSKINIKEKPRSNIDWSQYF
jgi:hypothetical protein